jgi:hypothetical protein
VYNCWDLLFDVRRTESGELLRARRTVAIGYHPPRVAELAARTSSAANEIEGLLKETASNLDKWRLGSIRTCDEGYDSATRDYHCANDEIRGVEWPSPVRWSSSTES